MAALLSVFQGQVNLAYNCQQKQIKIKRFYYYMLPCILIILDIKLLIVA
jgi:hypothetical protein